MTVKSSRPVILKLKFTPRVKRFNILIDIIVTRCNYSKLKLPTSQLLAVDHFLSYPESTTDRHSNLLINTVAHYYLLYE